MVCVESLYEAEVEQLDQEIRAYATRRSPFARKGGDSTVQSTDTTMVQIVNREVEAINTLADDLQKKIDALEKDVTAHKKEHMLDWAKRGLPEEEDDYDYKGVVLGDAMEAALKTRREAVAVAKAAHAAKIPLIVEPPAEAHVEMTDEELMALAAQAIANRKKK